MIQHLYILQNDQHNKYITYIVTNIFPLWWELLRSTLSNFQICNTVLLNIVTMLYTTFPWLICFTKMKAREFQSLGVSRDLTDFPYASWSNCLVISMQGSWVSLLWRQLSILLLELTASCLNEPIVYLSIQRTPLWMQPCKWACVKRAKESSDHLTELWETLFFFKATKSLDVWLCSKG